MPGIDPDLLDLASPEERQAYEDALRQETALLSPFNYALYSTPSTEDHPHQRLVDRYIVALVEHRLMPYGIVDSTEFDPETGMWHDANGEAAVEWLLLSEPPRHGKSYHVSEHTPPWFLTLFPDKEVILTSYEADFAASWGRKSRELIKAHPEFGIKVATDAQAAHDWRIDGRRGGMRTAGAGGPITGKGAHLMIVDDPIKNNEDALSSTQRNKLGQWFTSTVRTRLEPGGVGILMATRWHEDDLTGRMTSKPGRWFYLNLPGLAFTESEADQFGQPFPDPLGRAPGEALCPARKTAVQLRDIREHGDPDDDSGLSGEYWFNALYQGVPEIAGGGIIPKPYLYFEQEGGTFVLRHRTGEVERVPRSDCIIFATMDLASTTKTQSDWTVWSLWAATPKRNLLLLDVQREKMESPDHAPRTKAWYRAVPDIRYVGIENKTFGLSLIQELVRDPSVSVRPINVDTDKVARAIPAGNAVTNGLVFFPRGAVFLPVWEDELMKFPNGRNDDQVDTLSMAWAQITLLPAVRKPPPPPPATMEEKLAAYQEKRIRELESKRRKRWHPVIGRVR